MTVTNAAGSNICQGTFYVPQPEEHECGDGHIDRPNDNGVYEQCDNGPSFGDGCNNQCQLMTPSCTLMVDSQYQLV
jgi:cysteine-rich repeat protein